MSTFSTIIAAVFFVLLLGYLFYHIKQSPGQFSKSQLLRSAHTLGILALVLIAFIWLCIQFLNHT